MLAKDLLFTDELGGNLADRAPPDGDEGIGSGFFGKIGKFSHHGAIVAVKELKTGALDAASISKMAGFAIVDWSRRLPGERCGLPRDLTVHHAVEYSQSANEVNISMAIRPAQNVIQLFGICSDAVDKKLRIVMELCTNGSLRDYVKTLSSSDVC